MFTIANIHVIEIVIDATFKGRPKIDCLACFSLFMKSIYLLATSKNGIPVFFSYISSPHSQYRMRESKYIQLKILRIWMPQLLTNINVINKRNVFPIESWSNHHFFRITHLDLAIFAEMWFTCINIQRIYIKW